MFGCEGGGFLHDEVVITDAKKLSFDSGSWKAAVRKNQAAGRHETGGILKRPGRN